MIDSITLKDVQGHESLKIDLVPVTCLVGESRAGKSTVIRAVKWALLNQPAGNGMIRHKAKLGLVRLKIDGRTLTRSKGGKVNAYRLDKQSYAALGAGGVPESVQSLVNVSELSFQGQHDGPLWLLDSPGQVAVALNRLVNLEIIDTASSSMNSMLRSTRDALERSIARSTEANRTLSALEWVPGMSEAWQVLNRLLGEYESVGRQLGVLSTLVNNATHLKNRIETCQAIMKKFKALEQAELQLEMMKVEAVELNLIVEEAKRIRPDPGRQEVLESIRDAAKRVIEEYELKEELAGLVELAREAKLSWQRAENQAERFSTQAAALGRELAAVQCPLCGTKGAGPLHCA